MKIEYSSKAVKQLERLQKNQKLLIQLFKKIEELENNPLAGEPLEGEHEGSRSLRMGDWRIIYELDPRGQVALITRVAKRSEAYR